MGKVDALQEAWSCGHAIVVSKLNTMLATLPYDVRPIKANSIGKFKTLRSARVRFESLAGALSEFHDFGWFGNLRLWSLGMFLGQEPFVMIPRAEDSIDESIGVLHSQATKAKWSAEKWTENTVKTVERHEKEWKHLFDRLRRLAGEQKPKKSPSGRRPKRKPLADFVNDKKTEGLIYKEIAKLWNEQPERKSDNDLVDKDICHDAWRDYHGDKARRKRSTIKKKRGN